MLFGLPKRTSPNVKRLVWLASHGCVPTHGQAQLQSLVADALGFEQFVMFSCRQQREGWMTWHLDCQRICSEAVPMTQCPGQASLLANTGRKYYDKRPRM